MDSHDVGRGRGPIEGILHRIDARGLVVGISTDMLYPVAEVRSLAANVPRCRFAVLDSIHGHDGFLVDVDALNELILSSFHETSGIDEITGRGSAWA
jgi:homoserine O-acetyltransferase